MIALFLRVVIFVEVNDLCSVTVPELVPTPARTNSCKSAVGPWIRSPAAASSAEPARRGCEDSSGLLEAASPAMPLCLVARPQREPRVTPTPISHVS